MISVIIPVYNDPQKLGRCLEAIKRSTLSDYECIVVDDDSTDNTVAVVEQFGVKLIKLEENGGPAHARNCGAKVCSGDILFFIDSDVLIFPDTLAELEQAFDEHRDVDAIFGSYDDKPYEGSFISQFKNLFHHFVHQNADENICTFWSGCGAIRKTVFLKFDGFCESYKRPSIEDIELGYRLFKNKHKIWLKKDMQVKHLKHWTFWKLIKTDIFYRGIPWTFLILKDRIFPNNLNLDFSQRFSLILAFLLPLVLLVFMDQHLYLSFVPIVIVGSILFLNKSLYGFFIRKRGALFALRALPFHILYYYSSGLSFFLGLLLYPFRKSIV